MDCDPCGAPRRKASGRSRRFSRLRATAAYSHHLRRHQQSGAAWRDCSLWVSRQFPRHFDRLAEFPRGLLPFGDSICRFNPAYGQGMSVAAQEARLLHELLARHAAEPDPLVGLAPAFFAEAASLIETPWVMAATPDLA